MKTIEQLQTECAGCQKCNLYQDVKQIVFGVGPKNPKYMVIGEAPGFNEDIDGEPFTGKAGKLLMELIREVWNQGREEVFFTNTLKCRPPENRDPTKQEFESCNNWLQQQIAIIKPKGILTVGKYGTMAVEGIWNESFAMGRERSKLRYFYNIPCVATWHPAYILRQPDKKEEMVADMKILSHLINDKEPISIW